LESAGNQKQNWERTSLEKQENAAKHGARLRGWRATESHEDASQMSHVLDGTKGYTATTTAAADTTTTTTTTTVRVSAEGFTRGVFFSKASMVGLNMVRKFWWL
jgi:hypothetical protein